MISAAAFKEKAAMCAGALLGALLPGLRLRRGCGCLVGCMQCLFLLIKAIECTCCEGSSCSRV